MPMVTLLVDEEKLKLVNVTEDDIDRLMEALTTIIANALSSRDVFPWWRIWKKRISLAPSDVTVVDFPAKRRFKNFPIIEVQIEGNPTYGRIPKRVRMLIKDLIRETGILPHELFDGLVWIRFCADSDYG